MSSRRLNDESEIHSPNDWEHADLGSADRNEKFLRLMGGNRDRKHGGQIVIGEPATGSHNKAPSELEEVEHNLESQFEQGMERRIHNEKRQGFGCNQGSSYSNLSSDVSTGTAPSSKDSKKSHFMGFVRASESNS